MDNPRDLITRKHQLEVQFYCQYPKQGNVSLSFVAHRKDITVWEKGFGTFTYQFEFYPNNQFQTMMDPAAYPLVYDLGKRIYMKIKATSSVNNTELFVESCRAAPYDNPNYHPTYPIFENGYENTLYCLRQMLVVRVKVASRSLPNTCWAKCKSGSAVNHDLSLFLHHQRTNSNQTLEQASV